MVVKCYDEIPAVKLVNGPSPLDGLVVFEPDRYVCFDGFTDKAAELVCGELGFPAAEEFSAQTLLRTAAWSMEQLSCFDVPHRFQRLLDCKHTSTECSSSGAVRLKCQEPYGDIFSTGRYSRHARELTCPSQAEHESDQQDYYPFRMSFGICNHPGNVSNGYWDSNMTSFGSKITLTCDEGYIINGSATLQCVGLPGRSTYFPIWNEAIPVCWNADITSDGIIITTTERDKDNISGDKQSVPEPELTTLPETTVTSSSRGRQPTQPLTTRKEAISTSSVSGDHKREITIFTMVPLLCVVPVLLTILSTAWWKHYKKSNIYRTSRASNQSNDRQLQMHHVDTSNRNFTSTDYAVLNTTSINAGAEGNSFLNHPDNIFTDVMSHQEDPYHVYQDAAEVDRGPSQPSNSEQSSFCEVQLQSNITGSVLNSVNIPYINRNHGLQETSLNQTASGYEDCEYQDVDLCRNDGVKTNGSIDGAHLFDEMCYNSLNFGKRFAQNIDISGGSEYDHCNRSFMYDKVQSAHTDRSDSGLASQSEVYSHIRNDNASCSCVCSTPTVNCEDVFYYQLHPEEPSCSGINSIPKFTDAFDSGEYSLLDPDKGSIHDSHPEKRDNGLSDYYDPENPISYESNTRSCEELYATVNKTVRAYSAAKPAACEELYAKVDKQGDLNDNKATSQEELYMNVTNA